MQDKNNNGLCGNNWFSICKKCQEEVQECCRDLELTLFPDEVDLFLKADPKKVKKDKHGIYGYNSDKCIFLLPSNECGLQKENITKPIDCIIYPLNYKNGKIYLDKSCWAKELLNIDSGIDKLNEKLTKYPAYKGVNYDVRRTDAFIKLL